MQRSVVLVLACLALASSSSAAAQSQVRQAPSPGADGVTPQTQWTILSEPLAEGAFFSTSWSSDLPYDLLLEVTDLYVASDRFEVYDNGSLILTTPVVPDWDVLGAAGPFVAPPYAFDPNEAFASGLFSAGSVVLGPGQHVITIRDMHLPPSSAGGPPFEDGTVAFRARPVCDDVSALPAVPRDTVPPQLAQITPFTQNRAIIGATLGGSVAPPNVQFFPPNPAATTTIFWAIASQPANISVGSVGTFLVSVAYPDPLMLVVGLYVVSDVLSVDFVPNECSLVGVPVYTQGAVFETTGAIYLTNALDYQIGLF